MTDSYLTIASEAQGFLEVSRSKFTCTLYPIRDADEAAEIVRIHAKRFSDATHNCYGYVSNAAATEMKFSDDGEPAGTAGMPILEVLRKRKLCCVLAVVTRYFGGVKLGAGGLVSAYTDSVVRAIADADIVRMTNSDAVTMRFDYSLISVVDKYLSGETVTIHDKAYSEDVTYTVFVPTENTTQLLEALTDATLGAINIEYKGCGYKAYDQREV